MKKRVLFICTHNSARSQMAEGILRRLAGDRFEAHSAGTVVTGVSPMAIQVMSEKGIDISGQYSKSLDIYTGKSFDYVITVCDMANRTCPVFPGKYKRIHWSLVDPGTVEGTEEEKLAAFRKTRELLLGLIKKQFLPNMQSGQL